MAASLQVLFALHKDIEQQPPVGVVHVSDDALKASINFVETCYQQTAYMAGRDKICKELELYSISKFCIGHSK